ncbi:MAG: phosphodiester glycosidase family protein [Cytophagaceae bacterium]|nr:phosphodiester glycosidase family protein [Gemmatimonadaceae bacterium]
MAPGGALDFVPFGLTTPEMAAVMGALGARDAVMLDGGISSQLLIRDPAGVRRWTGLREVPLALVVRARPYR